MTGKKKIHLGPLPEELDYSKYEETVTRWDRVIAVVLVGLILLALLIYLLLGTSKPSSDIAQVEQSLVVPLSPDLGTSSQESNTQETKAEESSSQEPAGSEAADVSAADVPVEAEAPVLLVDTNINGNTQDATKVQIEAATEMPSAEPASATKNHSVAAVTILNPGIKQAILSDELADKGPGAPLTETVTLPESGITKVMLFTEMQGLLGRTLYHDWYRNGERQARVKVPVSHNEQQSFSSKFINLQMTGDWQVKVVDGKGKTYIDAAFKVIRP